VKSQDGIDYLPYSIAWDVWNKEKIEKRGGGGRAFGNELAECGPFLYSSADLFWEISGGELCRMIDERILIGKKLQR